MSISITNATVTPNQINNGTTNVVITFTGKASSNNVNVIVDFQISPFPELSFSDNRSVNAPYIFNTTPQQFSKTVIISNKTTMSSGAWENGLIALTATQHDTGDTDATYAVLIYQ